MADLTETVAADPAIRVVGVIGAGTMGSGIATALALQGIEVRLLDRDRERAHAAIANATAFYARGVEKGRITLAAAQAAKDRLLAVDGVGGLASADLVIEAVFEDRGLKERVLADLAHALAPTTLIATNTSCLRVDDLARAVQPPERFLGLHFFSPAAVNPLVEVVRGAATDAAVAERARAFCLAVGKRPLPCRDAPGFAINRFFCPYTNEAVRLVDEDLATPGAVDQVAVQAVGAAIGPFAVMNIVKPRINLDAIRNLAVLGDFYAPAAGMVTQGEADQPWSIEAAGPLDAELADRLLARLRAAVFLPVLELLDAGIAGPNDIDVGARLALRFERPPCALMDELGRVAVGRLVQLLCERYGRPVPAALAQVGRLLA